MKNIWITKSHKDLYSVTFESNGIEDYERLVAREMIFPFTPNEKLEQSHTVNLGLFSLRELNKIKETIDDFIAIAKYED